MADPAPAQATPAPAAAPAAPATPDPAPAGATPAPAEPKPSLLSTPVEAPKPPEGGEGGVEAKAPAEPVAAFDATKLKLPQGVELKPDDPVLKSYSEIMNDSKLDPQTRGQKLFDLYSGAAKQLGEANMKAWSDLNQQWVNEVKADPDVGGDKLEPTRQAISKMIDGLGPERAKALRSALDVTGAGNNPAIVKALATWSKAMTEGGHVPGSPGKGKPDLAKAWFENSPDMK